MGHYASVIYYEEPTHVKKRTPTQKGAVLTFPNVFRVRDSAQPYHCEKEIVLVNWRQMLKELEQGGYSVTRVSRATGVPRRTVQRWFNGSEEIPGYALFARVLRLYCYYKCKPIKKGPSVAIGRFNKGGTKTS